VTEHLWRALGRETRIIATDLNNAMLDYAITRRGALTNVTFEQADAQTLPYADATFDAVVCQFGLMFFPGKAAAIAEFARVLRPGGVLAFNVWDSFEHNRVAQIVHETIASFFEADPPDFLTIPFGYYETAPIEAAVAAAGLDGLQTGRVSAEIARPDATSIARGFIEGNPAILQIRERSTVEPGIIVAAAARAIEAQYGPAPLQIPLREITFVARKP
jgi:SAM-dependent methyltransferase